LETLFQQKLLRKFRIVLLRDVGELVGKDGFEGLAGLSEGMSFNSSSSSTLFDDRCDLYKCSVHSYDSVVYDYNNVAHAGTFADPDVYNYFVKSKNVYRNVLLYYGTFLYYDDFRFYCRDQTGQYVTDISFSASLYKRLEDCEIWYFDRKYYASDC
jgi:hypothetical protein